jgi:hypothetical protein
MSRAKKKLRQTGHHGALQPQELPLAPAKMVYL